jgi:hypothetical protein
VSAKKGSDRSQNDILINGTVQAVLRALLAEVEDGATIKELKDVMEGLLYYAEGKRIQ